MNKNLAFIFLLVIFTLFGCSDPQGSTVSSSAKEEAIIEDIELNKDIFKTQLTTAKYIKDENSMYVEFDTGLPDGTVVILTQYMPDVDLKYHRLLKDSAVIEVPEVVKDNKITHTFSNEDVNDTKYISAAYYFGVSIQTNYDVNSYIYEKVATAADFEQQFPDFKDSVLDDDENGGYTILYDDFTMDIETSYSLQDLIGEYNNEIPYKELEKNPDGYFDEKNMIKGEVLQIQEEDVDFAENGYSTQTVLRVNISDDPNEVIYVEYNDDFGTEAVRGDQVTVYGTITGSVTYDSVAGYSITIPSMEALFIE